MAGESLLVLQFNDLNQADIAEGGPGMVCQLPVRIDRSLRTVLVP